MPHSRISYFEMSFPQYRRGRILTFYFRVIIYNTYLVARFPIEIKPKIDCDRKLNSRQVRHQITILVLHKMNH